MVVDAPCLISHTDSEIISVQLKPWEGEGMGTKVYSHRPSICPVEGCKERFKYPSFRCPTHKTRPEQLRVQLSGIKDYPEGMRLYSNLDGHRLNIYNTGHFLEEIKKRILRGTFCAKDFMPDRKGRLLIKNFAEIYLNELERRSSLDPNEDEWLSLSAKRDYTKYIRHYVVPGLGELKLNEIRISNIRRWLNSMEVSSTVKRKSRDTLRHLAAFAVREEEMPPLPFEFPSLGRKGVKKAKKVIQTLTRAQQLEILNSLRGRTKDHENRHRLILRWLMLAGRRVNEVRAMRVRDVNLSAKEYSVIVAFDEEVEKPFPKVAGTAGGSFPMDDEMVSIIRESLAGRVYGPDSRVFINPEHGAAERPYTHRALANVYDRARRRAKYSVDLNEYGRHSWATQKINEGWSFDQVAVFLMDRVSTVEANYVNITAATRQAVIDLHSQRRVNAK